MVKHFSDISKEPNFDRPSLTAVVIHSFTDDDNLVLSPLLFFRN